jgi:hypothetical protein
MSHYEVVIGRCKKLERLLEEGMGANGRGLHEKVTSVQGKLPPALVKRLRFIATVRNKLVHESAGDKIDDVAGYKQACDLAEEELKQLIKPAKRGCALAALMLISTAILLVEIVRRWV